MGNFNFAYNAKALNSCSEQSLKWLEAHKGVGKKLNGLFLGFSEERFAIPSIINDKYGFLAPWNYCLHEAEQELNSAMTLVIAGMYKESFRSLRSFIELSLMGLYYFTSEDLDGFHAWLSGDKGTPTRKFLVDYLVKNNQRISLFEAQTQWGQRIGNFYSTLSTYVHTQGASGSFRSLKDSNMIVFSQRGLDLGVKSVMQSIQLVSEAFVANFPMALQPLPLFKKFAFSIPAGGFLDEWQVNQVAKTLSPRYRKILQDISDSNHEVKSSVDWVMSKSDLTPEEVMKSLEIVLDSFPDKRKEIYVMMSEGKIDLAFSILGAMQKAFLTASAPLLNEHFLGILSHDKNKQVRIKKNSAI